MNQTALQDLVVEKGQATVAIALGCSPAAISKALSASRQIIVTSNEDGTLSALEIRPFPSQTSTKKTAA